MTDHNGRLDRVGRSIRLIRWRNSPNGWQPEYATGLLLARDADGWLLDAGTATQRYSTSDWSPYRS